MSIQHSSTLLQHKLGWALGGNLRSLGQAVLCLVACHWQLHTQAVSQSTDAIKTGCHAGHFARLCSAGCTAQLINSCRITTHHLLFCIAPLPRCSIKRDINARYTTALLDLSPSGSRYESTVLRQTHLHTHRSAAILGRYCTHHNLQNTSLPSLATFITMEHHQSPRHCHSPLYRLVNSSISFRRPSASAQPRLKTSI